MQLPNQDVPSPGRQISRGSGADVAADNSVDLLKLVQTTWQRKWWLLPCLAVSLSLGSAFLLLAERLYSVEARLLVEQKGLPLDREGPARQEAEFLATQAQIIRSPAVVRDVARAFPPLPLPEGTDAVTEMIENLSVSPLVGTNVIRIVFRSADSGHAVSTVDGIIRAYQEYSGETELDSYMEVLRLLSQTEGDLRRDLESAEAAYQTLRAGSPLIATGNTTEVVRKPLLDQMARSLVETRRARQELELRVGGLRTDAPGKLPVSSVPESNSEAFEILTSVTPESFPGPDATDGAVGTLAVPNGPADSPELAELRTALRAAQAEEHRLLQTFGPRHPRIEAVQKQIEIWNERLRTQRDASLRVLHLELAAVREQEEDLARQFDAEVREAKAADDQQLAEQLALERIQRLRTMHDSTSMELTQWRMTNEAAAEGRSRILIQVLQSPELPGLKVWPPTLIVLAGCCASGIITFLGLIWCVDVTRPKFLLADAVQASLRLPVLGRIPVIPQLSAHRGIPSTCRVVEHWPASAAAEAFRALRAGVSSAVLTGDGKGCVIMVTSPSAGDGKSLIAANLAVSFAQASRRVLLIDADVRKGCLHRVFEPAGTVGPIGTSDGHPARNVGIQRTEVPGLDILPGGPAAGQTAGNPRKSVCRSLVEGLREKYDVILLDSVPLDSCQEALNLVPLADAAILLVRLNQTTIPSARRALSLLDGTGVAVAGVVVNAVSRSESFAGPDHRVSTEQNESAEIAFLTTAATAESGGHRVRQTTIHGDHGSVTNVR